MRRAEPTVVAVDADVVIYSAAADHPWAERITALFSDPRRWRLVGSTILVPELLIRPTRGADENELDGLLDRIARIELVAADERVCTLAAAIGATYGLRAADAVHLATAIGVGADAFLTNNRKDFKPDAIEEIRIVYPDAPELGSSEEEEE